MRKTPAQALLDGVTRGALQPALRVEGYRKAGRTFRRTMSRCVLVVNVQASQWSTADELSFTVNLGAFYPEVHAVKTYLTWQPSPSGPTEPACQVRSRIGMLMPDRRDKWWDLRAGLPPLAVTTEVMEAFTNYGLPWLARVSDFDGAWRTAEAQGDLVEAAAFALAAGHRDDARKLLTAFLSRRKSATFIRTWARQLGFVE